MELMSFVKYFFSLMNQGMFSLMNRKMFSLINERRKESQTGLFHGTVKEAVSTKQPLLGEGIFTMGYSKNYICIGGFYSIIITRSSK